MTDDDKIAIIAPVATFNISDRERALRFYEQLQKPGARVVSAKLILAGE